MTKEVKLKVGTPDEITNVNLETGEVSTVKGVKKQFKDRREQNKSTEVSLHQERKSEFNNELSLQNDLLKLVKDNLTLGTDFAELPGTKNQSLLQGGANKIALWAKLRIDLELVDKMVEVSQNIVYYKYKATAYSKETGEAQGSAFASCNSQENKFKTQSTKNIFDTMNTIDQMAQKRAYVRCVRTTCGLTGLFTQDMEENKVAPKEMRAEVYQVAERVAMNDHYIKLYTENNGGKKGTKDDRKKLAINQARKANNITNYYKGWTEDETKSILATLEKILKQGGQ